MSALVVLALLQLSTPAGPQWPPSWRVVLSQGAAPQVRDGRVLTAPDSFIKWMISDRCVVSAAADTAVIFSSGAGPTCLRMHLVSGTVRIVASEAHPVELTWNGGARTIIGVLTARLEGERVQFDGATPAEPVFWLDPALSARPGWQLQTRLHQLLKESFSRGNETLVQTAGSSSMCLDSARSAGDVGNNQNGITQMPPAAKLHIRVPSPRQVNR